MVQKTTVKLIALVIKNVGLSLDQVILKASLGPVLMKAMLSLRKKRQSSKCTKYHDYDRCPAYYQTCQQCSRVGQFAVVCKTHVGKKIDTDHGSTDTSDSDAELSFGLISFDNLLDEPKVDIMSGDFDIDSASSNILC